MKTSLTFTRHFLVIFFRMLIMTTPVWGALFLAILAMSWVFAEVEQIGFGDAMYFACVTALTIGYGDIVPATAPGKVVSVLIGILGVIATGIIVAVALQGMKITYETILGNTKRLSELAVFKS